MRCATIGLATGMVTGFFLVALGAVFVLVGWSAKADTEPPENGVATTAEIVGSVEETVLIDGIAKPVFSPVYEYVDTAGRTHRVTDGTASTGRPPTVGSIVEISYLPGDPESVRRTDIDRRWLQWFVRGGAIIAVIGMVTALLSLIVVLSAMARSRQRDAVRQGQIAACCANHNDQNDRLDLAAVDTETGAWLAKS
ncbi:DUF3592 domain-containing protein [Ilumatobacter sp.]|uniref:DUF3592 domain-containing protein n=1 Tax=Ilumatobacter sp. TaxID=1967498 RepID=UPI003C4FC301